MNSKLDFCPHSAAKYSVEHWHYSGSLPTPPTVKIGVWDDGSFVGVVIFGRGAASNINKQYGIKKEQVVELTRVALKGGHALTVSKILSIAIKMLRKKCPGLSLIVSYSDLDRGHIGTIYQASNWVYTGWVKGSDFYTDASGKRWHTRMLSQSGIAKVYGKYRRVLKPKDLTKHTTKGRYKYLYPLDAEMREQIAPLSKPYPKRAASIGNDAPGSQPGEGGVIPTAALQSTPVLTNG